ncbi:hypothetical protein L218DRAFT_956846 [Marasmius fiardii PR-910]|nr:hypothetical protein L218DRAFT_956846 [Marasmius fiardii PR-910]
MALALGSLHSKTTSAPASLYSQFTSPFDPRRSLKRERLFIAYAVATLFISAMTALLAKHVDPPAAGVYVAYQVLNLTFLHFDSISNSILRHLWTCTMLSKCPIVDQISSPKVT